MPPEGPPPQEPARPTALRPRPAGRSRALLWTLGIVAAILVLFVVFTGYYTEWLWFRSVGFSEVFTEQLTTRLLLFGFFGLLMAAALAFTMWLAHRLRPAFRGMTQEQQNLERYRVSLEPVRRRVVIGVSVLFGLLAGGTAAGQWRDYLLFVNSQPFRISDPQFGTDVSFYAFRLPFLRYLVGFGFATTFLCLVTAAVVHYLYGGIKLQSPGERFTPAARAHLSVLLGLFVLLKMASYWLDRYDLVIKDGHLFTGAGYTDISAILPAKNILVWIALVCALLFFANVVQAHLAAPRARARPADPVRRGHRRDLPGDRPAVPGTALREHQGEPVHRAQHQRHAAVVRPRRHPGAGVPGHVDPDGGGARGRPRAPSPTSGCSTPPSSRRPTSRCSRSVASTGSPTRWTSTAT